MYYWLHVKQAICFVPRAVAGEKNICRSSKAEQPQFLSSKDAREAVFFFLKRLIAFMRKKYIERCATK